MEAVHPIWLVRQRPRCRQDDGMFAARTCITQVLRLQDMRLPVEFRARMLRQDDRRTPIRGGLCPRDAPHAQRPRDHRAMQHGPPCGSASGREGGGGTGRVEHAADISLWQVMQAPSGHGTGVAVS
ncbi:hypothetical protein LDL36_08425 [Komagataeibacter sp. FNDCR1]|nr:hypothetical protein [Komagataeibacter sp. FNDCR1]